MLEKKDLLLLANKLIELKDTESAIKSKLIELLTLLKGFKFVATLFLCLKR